ncbi:hypothetical protein PQ459_02645 [Chryseobacterium sp. KACC 21268]|nr:hypothetical protein PQ459_02645 [Chryseobacterium sp. KACC 21268]
MKNIYLLLISFSLISCYTYKVKTESDEKPQETKKPPVKPDVAVGKVTAARANMEFSQRNRSSTGNKPNQPQGIQEKLEANKYFKIDVGGKPYKIQVDKWESDTLVAHVIHKPKKVLKFHKNQIDQSTIAERRFSNRTADIITVVAYASVGVGIYMLIK